MDANVKEMCVYRTVIAIQHITVHAADTEEAMEQAFDSGDWKTSKIIDTRDVWVEE